MTKQSERPITRRRDWSLGVEQPGPCVRFIRMIWIFPSLSGCRQVKRNTLCRLSIAPRPTPHRTAPRGERSVARTCTLHVPASDGRPRDPVCIEWDKVHLIETNLHRQSTEEKKGKKSPDLVVVFGSESSSSGSGGSSGQFCHPETDLCTDSRIWFHPFFLSQPFFQFSQC